MIALLSPSKTMDFDSEITTATQGKSPLFMEKTRHLAEKFRTLNVSDIMKLMKVSQVIGETCHSRFSDFSFGTDPKKLRPAVFAFTGETFKGLDILSFDIEDLNNAENSLRILSGLYGLLSPLTFIEPYRCEMGLKFEINGYKKISDFWKSSVTEALNSLLAVKNEKIIIDLASAEYMAAVDKKKINGTVTDIVFKEKRNGSLKTIPALSKKARGMMAAYIVKENCNTSENLKHFNSDGYVFDASLSQTSTLVFVR
jgi:hypothetical protein